MKIALEHLKYSFKTIKLKLNKEFFFFAVEKKILFQISQSLYIFFLYVWVVQNKHHMKKCMGREVLVSLCFVIGVF